MNFDVSIEFWLPADVLAKFAEIAREEGKATGDLAVELIKEKCNRNNRVDQQQGNVEGS